MQIPIYRGAFKRLILIVCVSLCPCKHFFNIIIMTFKNGLLNYFNSFIQASKGVQYLDKYFITYTRKIYIWVSRSHKTHSMLNSNFVLFVIPIDPNICFNKSDQDSILGLQFRITDTRDFFLTTATTKKKKKKNNGRNNHL